MAKIYTIIEETANTPSPETTEGSDEPHVQKTYTRPHTLKDIFLDVI
jgi:hypothetical protein